MRSVVPCKVRSTALPQRLLRPCLWSSLPAEPAMLKEVSVRKIVSGLFISLDGVVEAPHEWHFPYFNDEMGQEVGALMAASDTMLLGRRTYEEFASYWPHQSSDVPPADHMNNTPKVVVSTTL